MCLSLETTERLSVPLPHCTVHSMLGIRKACASACMFFAALKVHYCMLKTLLMNETTAAGADNSRK